MSLKNDSFPSSAAFDAIAAALSNDADKQDAIKKANSLFCFKLTNSAKEQDSWYIDLKKTGAVGKGEAPEGSKPDIILSLSEDDFGKLVAGKAQAQKLFMSGKLKVKGDVMKATKAEVVLKKAQKVKANL